MHMNGPFGPKPMVEAPMAALGGLVGSFIGGGATLAGMTSIGGIVGGLVGTVLAGTLLGGKQKSLRAPSQQSTDSQVPATPPAPAIPPVPSAPAATPTVPNLGGSVAPKPTPGASTDTTKPTAGVDVGATTPKTPVKVISTPDPTPGTDITPATPEDVAKGTLERKRKGRLSTILTRRNRASETDEEVERLGG